MKKDYKNFIKLAIKIFPYSIVVGPGTTRCKYMPKCMCERKPSVALEKDNTNHIKQTTQS